MKNPTRFKKPLNEMWINGDGGSLELESDATSIRFIISDGKHTTSFEFDGKDEYRKAISRFIDRFSTMDGVV